MFECVELGEIRQKLGSFSARFDADLLEGADAAAVVKVAAAIENMAASVKAEAARRVGATHAHRRDGHRSAAHQLAHESGIGVGRAKQQVATADPLAEGRLLEHAERRSLGELREECERVKAAADPDLDATRKRIHAQRSCRRRTTNQGGGEITYRSTLEEANEVWAVVAGFANTQFDLAGVEGRHEPQEAYAADGMLAMARAAAGSSQPTPKVPGRRVRRPVPAKVIFRVDWNAYKRGFVDGEETCDIAGVGPVPVSVVRDLLETDPFVAAVLTDGIDVISVAHLGRSQTYHHWALVEGKGKRAMVPPDHPDHPKNKKSRPPPHS